MLSSPLALISSSYPRTSARASPRSLMSATLSLGSVVNHKHDPAISTQFNGKKHFALGKMENPTDTVHVTDHWAPIMMEP